MKNSVGVIDSGYRGEILLRFNTSDSRYDAGEKIGQLIILPYPTIQLEEVEDLSSTERGEGGFGSTGSWWLWISHIYLYIQESVLEILNEIEKPTSRKSKRI